MIMMNTGIKHFQTVHTFISEPVILRHHIIVILQRQYQKLQNGTPY